MKSIESVIKSHQKVVTEIDMEDRVYKTTARAAFVTIKDHKENYQNNPQAKMAKSP